MEPGTWFKKVRFRGITINEQAERTIIKRTSRHELRKSIQSNNKQHNPAGKGSQSRETKVKSLQMRSIQGFY